MAITTSMTTNFKVGLLNAEFDFSSDTAQVFKIALYTSDASLGAATTAYTTSGEVASGAGYTTAGATLVIATNPTSGGTVAYLDFSDVTWAAASFSARGALIYLANGTTNPAIATIDFGATVESSGGNFVVTFPIGDSANAIIRIS